MLEKIVVEAAQSDTPDVCMRVATGVGVMAHACEGTIACIPDKCLRECSEVLVHRSVGIAHRI